ncbi:hypothetical protein DKX38_002695 [Salix brachista]|uniref:Uncharacterized protein n=1 Tax=Salix brachista TaxID=2182728 RepID=A0A5N5NNK9_9ROSI|nr:hypothetical protein DKX38_002695 [Salix brachista]
MGRKELALTECMEQVVMAMRTKGGDQAVFQSLHRARELYLNRLQESTVADQLASLFVTNGRKRIELWKEYFSICCIE